jgi:PAS domain S-box-containing protein
MNEFDASDIAQALFEEAGDALFLFDPETNSILDVNPMVEQLTGFARPELLGTDVSFLFRAEVPGGLRSLKQASRKTGIFHSQDGFYLRTQHDGVWTPVNLTVTRLHVQPKTLGLITARDIREQREAYAKLKKMEAEYARVLGSISDCVWSAGVDSRGEWLFRYFSPALEHMVGQPPRHFLGGMHRWWGLIHPEDRPLWEKALVRLRGGQPSQVEYRVVLADGAVRWLRDNVVVSAGEDGRPCRMDGVLSDITARTHAEEEGQRQENELRRIFNTASAALWVVDADDNLTAVNHAFAGLFGLTPEDMAGRPLLSLTDVEGRGLAAANLERCRQRAGAPQEYRFRRVDGGALSLTAWPCPSFGKDGQYTGTLFAMIPEGKV